jgi:catechol 2,3-dioxygenase-like lactoylglutathione lyase family enzyme
MELAEIVLYVRDMDRSVGFYHDVLGLDIDQRSPWWTTFHTGRCTLALHAIAGRVPGTGEPNPTFLVDDAPAEMARLASEGVTVTEIRLPVAGVQVFDAYDPDGNRFSVESRSS